MHTDDKGTSSGCPVQHNGAADAPPVVTDPRTRMPTGLDAASPSDRAGLGKQRQTSSIPAAPSARLPGHQPEAAASQPAEPNHWVYPSEQMFYNAMKRKVRAATPHVDVVCGAAQAALLCK